jgi:hypothetical protein
MVVGGKGRRNKAVRKKRKEGQESKLLIGKSHRWTTPPKRRERPKLNQMGG